MERDAEDGVDTVAGGTTLSSDGRDLTGEIAKYESWIKHELEEKEEEDWPRKQAAAATTTNTSNPQDVR
ncbi:hypothetical protein VM1G_11567 [Cytospora mali]|uniref:Uncharacterized protein n=1 Tax=Cytospora mali TaxID=578113 RepID=A0A194VXK0_CYTMA|nr:hypothetical protein VM1G_11567 [Valsa mali]